LINIKESIVFTIPSIAAVYLTRAFLMPAIPDPIITEPFILGKEISIMILFAVLMVVSAIMMLRNSKKLTPPKDGKHHTGFVLLEGAVLGVAAGLLRAGGGFLIIPALVLLMGMPMKEAVGASLLIIALKSLIGFIGDLQSGIDLQLPLLPLMISCTLCGMWSATLLSHRFDGRKLQRVFAYFGLVL
jgi:uncharacterized membrane protein YfcA